MMSSNQNQNKLNESGEIENFDPLSMTQEHVLNILQNKIKSVEELKPQMSTKVHSENTVFAYTSTLKLIEDYFGSN